MLLTFLSPRGIQLYDAVFSQHRRNTLDADFGRFLYDEIHALATRDGLDQMNLQWRLGVSLGVLVDQDAHAAFAYSQYPGVPFAVVAIEEVNRFADAGTQHAAEVACMLTAQLQDGTVAQCFGNK